MAKKQRIRPRVVSGDQLTPTESLTAFLERQGIKIAANDAVPPGRILFLTPALMAEAVGRIPDEVWQGFRGRG